MNVLHGIKSLSNSFSETELCGMTTISSFDDLCGCSTTSNFDRDISHVNISSEAYSTPVLPYEGWSRVINSGVPRNMCIDTPTDSYFSFTDSRSSLKFILL